MDHSSLRNRDRVGADTNELEFGAAVLCAFFLGALWFSFWAMGVLIDILGADW